MSDVDMTLPSTPTEGLVIHGNSGFPYWDKGWHQDGDLLRATTGPSLLVKQITEFIPCRIILPSAWDEMNAAVLDDIGNETWSASELMDTIEEVLMTNQIARKAADIIAESQ